MTTTTLQQTSIRRVPSNFVLSDTDQAALVPNARAAAGRAQERPCPGVFVLTNRKPISQQIEAALRYSGEFQFVGASPDHRPSTLDSGEVAMDFCLIDLEFPAAVERLDKLRVRFPEEWLVLLINECHKDLALDLLLRGADGCIDLESGSDLIVASLREIQRGGTPIPGELATRVLHLARSTHEQKATCDTLSRREKEIVKLLAAGALYKQIAAQLGISIDTVRRHITNLYRKLGVRSRTEAVLKCFSLVGKDS